MRKKFGSTTAKLLLALTGCSDNAGQETAGQSQAESMSVSENPAAADAKSNGQPGSATAPATDTAIPVSLPRIAYTYEYGFRLPGDRIQSIQQRHADMCESQGPQVCRILDMSTSGAEGDYASAQLTLAVAAGQARAFGTRLAKSVEEGGGEPVSSTIAGEDLSKQIVDTEARLRARTVLRDRLMEVLATRKGSVAELVEAERGVAQVNEEIDQARSWLTDMRQRVDYSRMTIHYNSGGPLPGDDTGPVRAALADIGPTLAWAIALLIRALTVIVPLGLFAWAIMVLVRRLRSQPQDAS